MTRPYAPARAYAPTRLRALRALTRPPRPDAPSAPNSKFDAPTRPPRPKSNRRAHAPSAANLNFDAFQIKSVIQILFFLGVFIEIIYYYLLLYLLLYYSFFQLKMDVYLTLYLMGDLMDVKLMVVVGQKMPRHPKIGTKTATGLIFCTNVALNMYFSKIPICTKISINILLTSAFLVMTSSKIRQKLPFTKNPTTIEPLIP